MLNPKHRSLIKTHTFIRFGKRGCFVATSFISETSGGHCLKQNPLLQHTRARGFLCRRQVHRGVDSSPATNALKICPDDSAIIRADFPRTRRWADAHVTGISGVLVMLIQERMANVQKKRAVRLATNRTAPAVRMVPLVREGVGDVAHDRNLLYLISLR